MCEEDLVVRAAMVPAFVNYGAVLWEKLHRWALQDEPVLSWLDSFEDELERSLPRCQCLKEWRRLVWERPMGNEPDLFEWTVWMHNQVNKKLGRREFPLEEARSRWSS